MKNKLLIFLLLFTVFSYIEPAYSEGFTANWVDIVRLNSGKFRVIIKYTNIQIGEYREAYVDFTSRKEAVDVFERLVKGATFFWGESKKIYFSKKIEKPQPY